MWHLELLANLRRFASERLQSLDLLHEYLQAIIEHWNEIFYLSLPALPVVAWWYLGDPPMWIKAPVFVWVLIIAGYYAWRKEYRRNRSQTFRSYINTISQAHDLEIKMVTLIIGLRIVNASEAANTIHAWQISFKKNEEGPWMALSDDYLLNGKQDAAHDVRGDNLKDDVRLINPGETREGWLAYRYPGEPNSSLLNSLRIAFVDGRGKTHAVDERGKLEHQDLLASEGLL